MSTLWQAIYYSSPLLRLLPAIFLAWVAWVVVRAPTQERPNRILGAFLAVVAAGFLVEFFNGLFSSDRLWVLQAILGILDPPLLLAYARSFPRPHPPSSSWWLWSGFGLVGAILFAVRLQYGPLDTDELPFWLEAVYVQATYSAAFLLLVRGYVKEERRYLSRQLFFLCLAIGFVAFSRTGAFAWAGIGGVGRSAVPWLPSLLAAQALLGLFLLVELFRGSSGRRLVLGVFGSIAAILGLFFLFWGISGVQVQDDKNNLGSFFFAYRWIVFSFLVGYGVLRYQLFDFELRTRQAAALLLSIALSLLLAVGLVGRALDQGWSPQSARLLGLLGGSSLGFLVFAGLFLLLRAANRLDAEPPRYSERRMMIYEATIEFAAQKPTWSPDDHLFLETLREVFGITPEEHAAVMARVKPRSAFRAGR